MNVIVANTKHNTRLVLHKLDFPQELSKAHRVKIRKLCTHNEPERCCGRLHSYPLVALAISSSWMEERPVVLTFARGRPYYIDTLTMAYGIEAVTMSFDETQPWREVTAFKVAIEPDAYPKAVDPKELIGE